MVDGSRLSTISFHGIATQSSKNATDPERCFYFCVPDLLAGGSLFTEIGLASVSHSRNYSESLIDRFFCNCLCDFRFCTELQSQKCRSKLSRSFIAHDYLSRSCGS